MKTLALVGLIACLASLPALAECIQPQDSPRLPDGATASREDMVAAGNAIRSYDAAVKEFAECERKAGSNPARADRAVEAVTAIAAKFNAELRAFKNKSGT